MSDVDRLERFPALIRTISSSLSDDAIHTKPEGGGFSILEQAWHLADLEVEGYTLRIARLLHESEPVLPDFDGDAIARERRYNELQLEGALRRFTAARLVNARRLRGLSESDWNRGGMQEGVGWVTLERVVKMMLEHDASHGAEIAALLAEMGVEPPIEETA